MLEKLQRDKAPILDNLQAIRDELTLLKSDRTSYVKAADVLALYDRTVEQVKLLTEIRADKPDEQNRVDRVLDGCFQLLSLFFMTIGKTNEAPAAYSLTSTIKRLLDHLIEVDLYSAKDLEHVSHTLDRLGGIVKKADESYSTKLITLLSNRIEICKADLAHLEERLKRHNELAGIHEKIISILRSISLANTKAKFSSTEVTKLQNQLKEIDAKRVDGKFLTADGQVAAGSDEVSEHLERCLMWSEIVLERKGQFPEAFKEVYQTLINIRNQLERLSLTQAWSLRETDLRCLIEVKNSGGVSSPRELYPYSMKVGDLLKNLQELNSIDNMRVDGKFMLGDDIPEGQGSISDLLAECFELSYELRVAAETDSDA
ncbi:hypothetical protein CJF32_00000736 [Rutstroemia sp. NJR-2017a WRK4]|nr:hypothetical protein CJF32_00000736 [Rutstroemia sp. NJR-2017a WRK4]